MAPQDMFTRRFTRQVFHWVLLKKENQVENRVETNSALPDHEIYGFKNDIKSLENFLLDQKVDNEFKSLVIVGEYGVGKTTLCKMIFNDEDVKSVYAPRIWISMPNNIESTEGLDGKICVLKKILDAILIENDMSEFIHIEVAKEGCGWTAKEKELSALLYALHLNLRWKKYLIVFDDVRDENNWDEIIEDDEEKLKEGEKWGKYLSDGFPKGSGGRVIYTTRDENLAKKLVAQEHKIHRLWPLSDHQSVWKIYDTAVQELGKEPPKKDKKCIDELMNKSRGVPLAARLLARLDPVFLDDDVIPDSSNHEQANSQSSNQTSS